MEMLRWILLIAGILIFVGIYLSGRRARRSERELEFDFEAPDDLPEDAAADRSATRVTPQSVRAELEKFEEELDHLSEIIAGDRSKPAESPRSEAVPREPVPGTPVSPVTKPAARQPASGAAAPSAAKPVAAKPAPAPDKPAAVKARVPVEEMIVTLYLAADPEQPFAGPDIDRALRSAGLVHGEMSIYHKLKNGTGAAVFSVANIVEPGTFDPAHLDDFTSPGITLFMQLPGPVDGLAAFDAMVAAGRHVADQLHGELRDRQRNPLSKQMIAHLREDIQEYQRRQHMPPVSA